MAIGQMRARVTIQNRTVVRDALGAARESWADVATVWAEVVPVSGQERLVSSADVPLATATHRVMIRYRDDVTPLSRLVWAGRVLDVASADPPVGGKNDVLICFCEERVGETV